MSDGSEAATVPKTEKGAGATGGWHDGGRPATGDDMSAHHPERKELAERDLEFYAQGMWDLFCALGGDNHCKHYDPLTFMDGKALSYVLHLRDGGRSHEVYDLEDMRFDILEEFIEMFGDEFGVGYR